MSKLTHWHIITDCSIMGTYTTREQAENMVYEYLVASVGGLLQRWTEQLLDTGWVTFTIRPDEVEGWLIEECDQSLNECDPLPEPGLPAGQQRIGYFHRLGDDQL